MGLTIKYELRSRTRSAERAKAIVAQMRQLALDLPFESVGDMRYFGPDVCQQPIDDLRDNRELFDAILDGSMSVNIPWSRKRSASIHVQPLEIFSFETVPGPGSEPASFGLVRFPGEIEADYRPEDDDRFIATIKRGGSTRWQFDWMRWRRWLERNGHPAWTPTDDFQEKRTITTRLPGWRYGNFCKTQYASDPRCGGVPNFIRCHLCVIHLLDRIAQLPTMKVETDDEGKYGRSYYTDDPWAEERVYTWHEGQYNVKALIQEVGEWNEMIAAGLGAWQDAARAHGAEVESPITSYPDFEHLEFKGQRQEYLAPFLAAMKELAERKEDE